MPFARMTTRRWMIAVAIIGLILASVVTVLRLRDRRERRMTEAKRYWLRAQASTSIAKLALEYSLTAKQILTKASEFGISPNEAAEMRKRQEEKEAEADRAILQAEYFEKMRQKYEHAADHPWITLPPDAPMPN